ncbi:MAG: PD-(D/E)XK nuclease family protein [Candidatus Wildermuthbacteria bacterium]|nr:PD-(D/E)XK nuclease family protein [Candidatus Wildermuthbacteria bacterium]
MKHVSFTQLMTYVRCPEHFLFRYILGMKRPPGKAQKHGFALHETFAYHFDQKKKDSKGLKVRDAKEFFVEVFRSALQEYEMELEETKSLITREFLAKEKTIDVNQLVATGLRGIDVYFKEMNPTIIPDLVEEPFAIPTPSNVDLVGRMDMTDKKGIIHEMKTTRRMPNAQDINLDQQLAIYQLAYEKLKGKKAKGIAKDYIVFSKRDAKIVQFKVSKPFFDKNAVMRNIASIMNAVKHNVFYCIHPAESWVCSKEWCGFYRLHGELRKAGLAKFMARYMIKRA